MNPANFPLCFLNTPKEVSAQLQSNMKYSMQPKTVKSMRNSQEMQRIKERLKTPRKEQLQYVHDMIQAYFPGGIGKHELIMIAVLISGHIGIQLDRDARRRRNVLLAWYWEHWSEIFPYLKYVRFECEDGHTLTREELCNTKIISVLHSYKKRNEKATSSDDDNAPDV